MLRNAITDPRFMYQCGEVAIYLTHRYPQTHQVLSKLLPRCLKDLNMMIYEGARALDLKCKLICTTKESRDEWAADMANTMYGGYDDFSEEHHAFGMYFPKLKTLKVGWWEGDEGPDMSCAYPMLSGQFVWLDKAGYGELSNARLAVSCS